MTEEGKVEFAIRRRISVNRCLSRFEKSAAWGALLGRAAKGIGGYAAKHPGKSLFGGAMAYQGVGDAKNMINDWSNSRNPGGNRFITADGHRKSTAAKAWNTLGTIGDWTWWIPGFGWASVGLGLAGHAIGSAIQNRADKQWAKSQASLRRAGLGANPYGKYGNRPRVVK